MSLKLSFPVVVWLVNNACFRFSFHLYRQFKDRRYTGISRNVEEELRRLILAFRFQFTFGIDDDGVVIDDVELPKWAASPEEFVMLHRAVSDVHLSKHILFTPRLLL